MTTYSKTQVLIDSKTRIAGTPSEYYVSLQPKIRDVVKIKFCSFEGGAFPYTFTEDTFYVIDVGRLVSGAWTYQRVRMKIPQGMYDLPALIALLNSMFTRARLRIEYNETDHRVVISKNQFYFSDEPVRYTAASPEGRNPYVDRLIGFPMGWGLSDDPNVFAVMSSFAVQREFLPNPMMIVFSNWPGKVVSSSGIIGGMAIPYTARTFEFQANKISWSQNEMYELEIETYCEYIDHLGIRIVDSHTGQKYQYMEEHTLLIEVTHADVKTAKPYPTGDLHLLE